MATWYVDFESGTGDGSTTSSPAGHFTAINGNNNVAAGDTIKIKGSPNPTLVGTASAFQAYSHAMWYAASSFPTITYSTTAGETTAQFSSSYGNMTGRTMEIEGNTQDKGNFNGMWRVGANVSGTTYKIEEFQGTGSGSGSGSNGDFWDASGKVAYLDSSPIQDIASTGPRTNAWTAASDVTATIDFNSNPNFASTHQNFEHRCNDKIDISANHGTGLAAYYPVSFSSQGSYQQISFQIATSSGSYTDGLSLRLCTGSDGTGSVLTIPIDFTGISNTWQYIPTVKDFGSALNSSGTINSVALYVDTDNGARTLHISNIIACKASSSDDSITHNSILSFNTADDPVWRPIKTLRKLPDGKCRVEFYCGALRAEPTGYQGSGRVAGFAQDYSSANIYKRETIIPLAANLNSGSSDIFYMKNGQFNGSSGSPITVSGGWNSDYSSQSLDHTLIDLRDRKLWRIEANNSYINLDKFGVIRHKNQVYFQGTFLEVDNFICITSSNSSIYLYGSSSTKASFFKFKAVQYAFGSAYYLYLRYAEFLNSSGSLATIADKDNFECISCVSGSGSALMWQGYSHSVWGKLEFRGSIYNGYGIDISRATETFIVDQLIYRSTQHPFHYNMKAANIVINNVTLKNVAKPFRVYSVPSLTIQNFTSTDDKIGVKYGYQDEAVEINDGQDIIFFNSISVSDKKLKVTDGSLFTNNDSITGDYANNKVTLTKGAWHKRTAGGVSGVFENFYNNGLIYPETSIRNTASGYSWKFTTTNSSNATSGDPLALDLGTIAVNGGNKTVTVTVYAYRTSLSAFGRLKIKQNQLIGLTSDVTATTSGGINTWEQLSLTFNPSSSGYVDIAIEAYDGSSNVYFDDVGVTQAT